MSFTEILHADIFKTDIADQIVVSGIDGHAPLVIQLLLPMVQNVDIDVIQILKHFRILRVTMDAYEYGMGHICPKRGVLHRDMLAAPLEPQTCAVHRRAIVRISAEHPVEQHIITGKDIHPVSPPVIADSLHIAMVTASEPPVAHW